jgi:hypothetical protein
MLIKLIKCATLFAAISLIVPVVADDDVETITIFGERPLSYYKNEVRRAQKSFFKHYNKVASEEDFRMHCSVGRRVGAHRTLLLGSRECQPKFIQTITNKYVNEFLGGSMIGDVGTTYGTGVGNGAGRFRVPKSKLRKIIMARYQDQLVDMIDKIEDEPDVKAAYDKLTKATVRLREKQAKEEDS